MEDLAFKTNLEFIRIYFDSSMFEKISKVKYSKFYIINELMKDKRAKIVDMVAAFGGTLGLLSGFSLISGFEIIFFLVKIIINYIRNCHK